MYKSGNNVLYFTGLTQVPDPSIKLLPSNLQSLSTLYAVQNAAGQIVLQNPAPGQLGTLSPTNFRALGSFTLNLQVSKPIVLNREHNIVMILRGDAINVLNKPDLGYAESEYRQHKFWANYYRERQQDDKSDSACQFEV